MEIVKANERLIQIANNIAILNQPGPLTPTDRVQIDLLKEEFNSLLMEQRGIPNDPRLVHVPNRDRLKSRVNQETIPAKNFETIRSPSPLPSLDDQISSPTKSMIPGLNPIPKSNSDRSSPKYVDDFPIYKRASNSPRLKINLDYQKPSNTVAQPSCSKYFNDDIPLSNSFEALSGDDTQSEDDEQSEPSKNRQVLFERN
ncbi:hypothetical protein JTE90_025514 [Oedothorax gibbosus]|uniref:Uncharacterized protein n=1 Tax=Oedothorax gibbosus TaxID=931172 RepID=A0AAV6TNG7_9ARAC|nr:hypothetical protein JTE90_025514 [Oedothorax gibbosus]